MLISTIQGPFAPLGIRKREELIEKKKSGTRIIDDGTKSDTGLQMFLRFVSGGHRATACTTRCDIVIHPTPTRPPSASFALQFSLDASLSLL